MSPYNFNEMCEINSLHVTLNIIFLSNDSLGRIRIWGDIWWYHRLISAWPICESHRTHVLDRISVPHLSVTCLFILWTTEKQAVDVIKTQTLFCVVGILLLISSAVDSVYPLPTTLTDESYSVSFYVLYSTICVPRRWWRSWCKNSLQYAAITREALIKYTVPRFHGVNVLHELESIFSPRKI